MEHDLLEYRGRVGPLHALDPRPKLLVTLAFVLLLLATPPTRWPAVGASVAFACLLLAASRLPLSFVLKRTLVILPFVLVVGLSLPFLRTGEGTHRLAEWQLGPGSLVVTREGLEVLWGVLLRAVLGMMAVVVLGATTPFPALAGGLRRLGLPRTLTLILSFLYRYLFVLVDEVTRMNQARESRSYGGSRLWHLRTVGRMVGTLFVRSIERGERVYQAMLSRGFEGQMRTLVAMRLTRADSSLVLLAGAGLASVLALRFVP